MTETTPGYNKYDLAEKTFPVARIDGVGIDVPDIL